MMPRLRWDRGAAGVLGACAALLLSGCGQGGGATQAYSPPTSTTDPIAIFAASSSPGSSGTVVLPDTGQSVQVRLLRAYYAASGRECREVAVGSSQSVQLICQTGQAWVSARPLIAGNTGTP